ncbi:MAG: T9SS type A sorting domain-containing protein [Salibacteraceae bacterium]
MTIQFRAFCATLFTLCLCVNAYAQLPILFQEDFSNGLTGGSTNGVSNGAWTTNGNSNSIANPNAIWEYRGTSTTPNNTIGSRGAFTGVTGIINSTTASNGFMIFDSDYLDNNGVATNLGTGNAPAPHESWLISNSFSTIGYSNVTISFTSFYYRYAGDGYLLLSNDNGATWGDTITIFDSNFGINITSNNDEFIYENINYLGNVANAKIAFFFDGVSTINLSGPGYYFFMVDDIKITQTPANDLKYESYTFISGSDSDLVAPYSMIPLSQANTDTMQFRGVFNNIGAATQSNAKVIATISTPTGNNTLSSVGINSVPGVIDSVYLNPSLVLNQGIGQYSCSFKTSADSMDANPTNNYSDTLDFLVTDTTYARDRDATGNSWYGAGSSFEIGCKYSFNDTAVATSISVQVGNSSIVGEPISVYLYNEANMNTPLASHEFIPLTAADIGSVFSVSIPNTTLPPGSYVATLKSYTDQVTFPTSPQTANPWTVYVDPSAGGTWFYASYIPVVRLNIQPQTTVCNSTFSFVSNTPISCPQSTDGSVTVNVASGTAPFTYAWSNGSTADSCTNIGAGWHTVTVTDNNACVAIDSVFIHQPAPINANITVTDSISCNGSSDGEIVANSVGGTLPHSYNWSNSIITDTNNNLSAGWYKVTITDGNLCVQEDSIQLTEPSVLNTSITLNNNQLCPGINNGSATATASGGSAPYAYNWINNGSMAQNDSLHTGWNYLTITDNLGCSVTDSIQINASNLIPVNIGSDTIVCHNAAITLTATGSYTSYIWNTGSTNGYLNVNTFLPDTSIYWVEATNSNGCVSSDSAIVIVKNLISPQIIGDSTLCAYDSAVFTTINSYQNYYWSTLENTSSITVNASTYSAGINSVTLSVSDSNQCAGQGIFNFEVYPEVVVDLGQDTIVNNVGTYLLDAGSNFTSYLWPDGSTDQTYLVDSLNPQWDFWVIVTDSNGCIGSDSVIVEIWIGIHEYEKSSLKIYPNPANEYIQLQLSDLPNSGIHQIEIYSFNGASVLKDKVFYSGMEITKTLHISTLKPGNYMVKISSENWTKSIPIIVQH